MALFTKSYNRPGSAPGEIAPRDDVKTSALLSIMNFSEEHVLEEQDADLETCRHYLESPNLTWLHVQGYPSQELLHALGEAYELHPLALEDVINTGQRTKAESYDDQYFIVMNRPIETEDGIRAEQISLFLGDRYVVSIHHGDEDILGLVRQRLRADPPRRIRKRGPDYLLYALLDAIVDHAFPLLEAYGEQIEALEQSIFENPTRNTLDVIHRIKRSLLLLRRILWPQREILSTLVRDDHILIQDETKIFLRDCYDHTIQIMELVESYREMASSLLDVYLSSLSNRMNEVMKVLTIIATIFIPLSFIAGIYGMNFDTELSPWNMPELSSYFGYPVLWLIMIGIACTMLVFFKRNGWF